MQLGQEPHEVLQAAAEPINRPRYHYVELALGGIAAHGIEGRSLVPALGAADAVVLAPQRSTIDIFYDRCARISHTQESGRPNEPFGCTGYQVSAEGLVKKGARPMQSQFSPDD